MRAELYARNDMRAAPHKGAVCAVRLDEKGG